MSHGSPTGLSGYSEVMKRSIILLCATLAIILVAAVVAAPVAPPPPGSPAALESFDRFARRIGPFCVVGPSRACFERGFVYADADHDGTLSLDEAERMQGLVSDWALASEDRLAPQDRRGLVLGLLVLQIVGLDQLFASYDLDHDGKLTPAELSADVRLDDRPLPQLIQDSRAIDWPRLEARLGPAAALVSGLRPPAG